jgi:hypothetical protein
MSATAGVRLLLDEPRPMRRPRRSPKPFANYKVHEGALNAAQKEEIIHKTTDLFASGEGVRRWRISTVMRFGPCTPCIDDRALPLGVSQQTLWYNFSARFLC